VTKTADLIGGLDANALQCLNANRDLFDGLAKGMLEGVELIPPPNAAENNQPPASGMADDKIATNLQKRLEKFLVRPNATANILDANVNLKTLTTRNWHGGLAIRNRTTVRYDKAIPLAVRYWQAGLAESDGTAEMLAGYAKIRKGTAEVRLALVNIIYAAGPSISGIVEHLALAGFLPATLEDAIALATVTNGFAALHRSVNAITPLGSSYIKLGSTEDGKRHFPILTAPGWAPSTQIAAGDKTEVGWQLKQTASRSWLNEYEAPIMSLTDGIWILARW
jgi:hypothetical protein